MSNKNSQKIEKLCLRYEALLHSSVSNNENWEIDSLVLIEELLEEVLNKNGYYLNTPPNEQFERVKCK